ncbi:MAG: phage replisome organizer N-terminal domain-containing protein, partial [Clostridia bacterium]|nr:phage replisome organizer N-terminal domain-containing protein [Clostridia bacterium]
MALRWIKLKTDIFTSDKMLLLETYEDGLYYQMIWLKLLCLAGRKENHGIFMMRDGRGYTAPMLSHILSVDTDMLEDALSVFEELCMISNDGGIIKILGWREHQEDYFDDDEPCEAEEGSSDERKRKQAKERMRRMRERKRYVLKEADSALAESDGACVTQDENSVTDSVTGCVTPSVTSVTGCVTSVTPLININNRTEQNKEEHTSLREEREKNKKENPVTLTGDGKSLFLNAKGNENSLIVNIEGTDALSSSQPPASLHSPDEVCAMDEQRVCKSFGVFDNVML